MRIPPRLRPWGAVAVLSVVALGSAPNCRAGEHLRLAKPEPGELLVTGFSLDRPANVGLEAIGLVKKNSEEFFADVWILDLDSRRSVWSIGDKERDIVRDSRLLRKVDEMVRLDRGRYRLYLYAGSRYRMATPFKDLSNFLRDLAALLSPEDPGDDLQKYLDRCYVKVKLPPEARPADLHECSDPPDALIAYTRATDGVLFTQPFRVARDTRLRVYSLGEAYWRGDIMADYAWVENASSGEAVWLMDLRNSGPAGGAKKNLLFDGEVSLAGGDYIVHYITDDSHSWAGWNAPPPRDPEGYGVILLPGRGFRSGDLQKLKATELRTDPRVLVRISKVRDHEHRREQFTLERSSRVHVYALGEGDRDEMWDLGWIVDLDRKQTVWRMTGRDTRQGGGADKNRLFEGEIELTAGRYEVHYETDDSHAFGSWNALPPQEPHRWGITISLAD